jgi:hypothetical protein
MPRRDVRIRNGLNPTLGSGPFRMPTGRRLRIAVLARNGTVRGRIGSVRGRTPRRPLRPLGWRLGPVAAISRGTPSACMSGRNGQCRLVVGYRGGLRMSHIRNYRHDFGKRCAGAHGPVRPRKVPHTHRVWQNVRRTHLNSQVGEIFRRTQSH